MKDGWLPREEWLKTLEVRPASAGVIVENVAGEALIVKASYKTHWSTPGGMIDAGETPLQAAIRELREEVGLEVSPDELRLYAVASRQATASATYHFVFTVRLDDQRLRSIRIDGEEIAEWRFVSRQEVHTSAEKFAWVVPHWASGQGGGYIETQLDDRDASWHEAVVRYRPSVTQEK